MNDAQDGRDGPPAGSPIPEGSMPEGAAPQRPILFRAARYAAIGFEFPTTVGAGLMLGHYADGYFGSAPWMVLALGLLGLVVAFYRLVLLLRHFSRERG